ncbi:MAG TPA: adenylate/guanylate cyclase domain-containing protein, partial [Ilumatobacteraceae bacterium]|nr:adenylate/guanylate cyclase domain-containing protein [Ilumatobacteraceae bacterium]
MTPRTEPSDPQATLTAFVPRLAVELGHDPTPSWTSLEGSMLSADISGFTALSEKLAGKGKAGAEEITALINTCFTTLIDSAYGYGGEVIKFGGDALLVLFRGDHHERRAADAGLLMQRALHSSSAAKRANLTMTVGIAAGPFDVFLVGSGYRELLITGPRATEVIRLEGEAAKGDTLVDPLIAEHLPADMKLREEHGGWVITGSTGDEPSGPRERHLGHDDLSPYVPAAVVEQLAAFSGTGGEHRLVSVGFLMVIGVGALLERKGPDAVAAAFHRLVDDVERICGAYGVTALHTDIAPDGIKFVLCAGAPVNPGDTSDALLQAALRLAAVDSPFVLRQGVQTGRVFAGFLGSKFRRTYTLMGDPVNTAARMLGKAEDRDIVAVATVVQDTRTVFVTEALEPFLVKGKTEPVVAHKVLAGSDEVRRDTSGTKLVGRQRELDVLTHAIGELGEVVILSGGAGVGKTRLLDAAWAASEGLRIFQGACTPYGSASPYNVFRPLLRAGTGIDLHADPVHAGELLDKTVRQSAPDLLPMLPLLAVPFGADVTPTPQADAIDPQFRRARIHDLVVDFLDQVLDGPVFLVVEDLHWIDEASGELLNHLILASESRPWAGVLTRRPEGPWQPPDDAPHVTELHLAPLTDDDIRRIALEASTAALSDDDVDAIVGRSGGNPLFTIELSRALSRGSIADLPDSIEGLISTRIDLLPPEQRWLLRVAAVFGREFGIDAVAAVGDSIEPAPELHEIVEPLRDRRYRFRHAMYRDAAYEGLPYRERQRLHRRVGEHLESTADDPEVIASLLSLHFHEARAFDRSWRYSRSAGDQAARQYAHRDAALALGRAVTAGAKLRSVSDDERRQVSAQLGDTLLTIGDYDAAFASYRRARRLADRLDDVDLMRKQGIVRDRQGSLDTATRWYERCLKRLPETAGTRREREMRMKTCLAYSAARHRQGRFEECLAWAQRAETDARHLGDDASLASALDRLHVAATYLKRDDAERYGPEALALHTRLGDHLSTARILDNMGIQAYFAYDWATAL